MGGTCLRSIAMITRSSCLKFLVNWARLGKYHWHRNMPMLGQLQGETISFCNIIFASHLLWKCAPYSKELLMMLGRMDGCMAEG